MADFQVDDEIARLEAEMEKDDQLRAQEGLPPASSFIPQAQQQQVQQPQTTPFMGFAPQQQQQVQQPQQSVFGGQFSFGGFPMQQQQVQQQQQVHQQPPQQQQMDPTGSAPKGHQFSKDSDGRSIFVGNLPKGENGGPTTTPQELANYFSDCGPILNCTLLVDRATNQLKGTAYIEFATYTAMGTAIDTKNNSVFNGSTIIVSKKRSNFKPERARGRGRGGVAHGGGMDPYQAMMALVGMMGGGGMGFGRGRGGARGRGRGGAGAGAGAGAPPGYQPF